MKRNFFKGAALAAIALVGFTATAQEEESKGIELTGSVDTYFKANLNASNTDGVAPATSFANQDGFALGMVNLIASKQVGKVGFVADLVFGPRGADAVFASGRTGVNTLGEIEGSSDLSAAVNQLYVTYAASDAVTLTLGNFNTFLGYEVISPTGNFNYSTSYMFSYGPFSHTGVKADFALNDNWSLMTAVLNPTDATEFNPTGQYFGGLQLGYSADAGSAYLNFLFSDDYFQADITTGWDVAEDFYLGVNATYAINDTDADSGFAGIALYPQYAISESFSLGLRGEFFTVIEGGLEDVVGLDADGDGSVFATTLTGSYTVGGLTIKPELRLDSTSEDFFVDSEGDNINALSSFVLGAYYAF